MTVNIAYSSVSSCVSAIVGLDESTMAYYYKVILYKPFKSFYFFWIAFMQWCHLHPLYFTLPTVFSFWESEANIFPADYYKHYYSLLNLLLQCKLFEVFSNTNTTFAGWYNTRSSWRARSILRPSFRKIC